MTRPIDPIDAASVISGAREELVEAVAELAGYIATYGESDAYRRLTGARHALDLLAALVQRLASADAAAAWSDHRPLGDALGEGEHE